MEIATVDNTKIGTRVLRGGPDWRWGDQDRDSAYGVVTGLKSNKWVMIAWYSKDHEKLTSNDYRIGADNCYDLYLAQQFSLNGNIKKDG